MIKAIIYKYHLREPKPHLPRPNVVFESAKPKHLSKKLKNMTRMVTQTIKLLMSTRLETKQEKLLMKNEKIMILKAVSSSQETKKY